MRYVVVGPKEIYGPFLIEKEAARFRDHMVHCFSTPFSVHALDHPAKGRHRATAERNRQESWMAGKPLPAEVVRQNYGDALFNRLADRGFVSEDRQQ